MTASVRLDQLLAGERLDERCYSLLGGLARHVVLVEQDGNDFVCVAALPDESPDARAGFVEGEVLLGLDIEDYRAIAECSEEGVGGGPISIVHVASVSVGAMRCSCLGECSR